MDVREKLVGLLKTDACPAPFMCDPACRYYGFGDCFPDRFADYLLDNGVTVQEWIPVTERLPDKNNRWVLCLCVSGAMEVLKFDYTMWNWDAQYPGRCYMENYVTHWMPLPEPPKGE